MDPSVSTQPAPPNTSPSVPQTTPALLPVFTENASGHPSSVIYRLRNILINLLQVVSVSILIVIGFVALPGLPLALFASMGAMIMLVGNGFLRITDPHFTNNTSAATIGVVGSLILSPPLYLLYLLIPTSPGVPRYKYLKSPTFITLMVIFFPLFSMVTGLIGSAVLLQCRVDLGGIDILNACYAGAFGGIALDGPALLTFRFFPLLVSFIISSICLAIMRGVQWIHLKWTENWMDRSHLHSYGSRGDDLEINAELQSKTQPNPPGPSRY